MMVATNSTCLTFILPEKAVSESLSAVVASKQVHEQLTHPITAHTPANTEGEDCARVRRCCFYYRSTCITLFCSSCCLSRTPR